MYTAKQTGILCSSNCSSACHNVNILLSMVYWLGYWLGINHVQFPAAAREFSVLQSADWLWVPLNLLFSGYWGQSGWGMKLNVHCQLVTRLMNNEWSYTYTPPTCFHGVHRGNLLYTNSKKRHPQNRWKTCFGNTNESWISKV